MNDNNIDEVLQWYESFVEIVRQLSLNAEDQIQKLKGTVVTDEIASDFSEIGMPYAEKLLSYGWITQEQLNHAQKIGKMIDRMTQNKELWNDDALLNSDEWNNCRKSGRALLQTLDSDEEKVELETNI